MKHVGWWVAAGAAVAAAAILYEERKAAAAPATPSGLAVGVVSLVPGPMATTVAAKTPVVINPPTGGQITSATSSDGSAIAITSNTIAFTPTSASGYLTVIWTASNGAQQTTTVNYTVTAAAT